MSTSFPPPPQNCGSGKDFIRRRLDREKPGEQWYKDHADYGYTSTGHELLHALALGAGVVVAVTFQQVDNAPDTVDLIQMIADKNNLHDVDTWMIFKWVFKSAAAILIVTNTWNIVMGVFDMAQNVVAQAAGIINSDASIDISSVMTDLEPRLMEMDLGPLFGLWFQSLFIGITMWALYICIFIVIYGRMIEIYRASRSAAFHPKAVCGHFGNPALASR